MMSHYQNSEWTCNAEGMEKTDSGYFIEKERLNEIADYVGTWCSDWLVHIANKNQDSFDYESFVDAFYQAFLVTGTPIQFDWRRSVEYGRATVATGA